MTVKADRLGPGRLTIGATGSPREFGAQVTKMELLPESNDGDIVTVLSGDELVDGEEDTAKLSGEFFQDYELESLIKWTWDNHRAALPFEFVPATDGVLGVRGTCRVKRVKIGGDVKARNKAPFEFPIVGDDVELFTPAP